MEPDKAKPRKSHPQRDEFEVAYYTKELGRTIQRKLLQQQMDASGSASSSAHGEDNSFDSPSSPPQHDRAG
jgi:hypothetical protein